MSSTPHTEREARAVRIGNLCVGTGPVVVIGGEAAAGPDARWVSLREHGGRRRAEEAVGEARAAFAGPLLVEPFSSADLPAIQAAADAVVIGGEWAQDLGLVGTAARLGLPVVVRRGPTATLEEWLAVGDYCAAEGNDDVVLCESGSRTHLARPALDLALMRAARERSGRPVLAGLAGGADLAAPAVAAGADGLMVAPEAGAEAVARAREAAVLIGAVVRQEVPDTVATARGAIDRVDAALAVLLERRAALAGVVQRLKPVGGFAGRDMERERRLVAAMAERAPTLGEAGLAPVMNAVIEAGLRLAERQGR
ncbi:chorismate mutase [Sinosporangium album]|uniref:Chorismate mutase n=1 Tax=Sinosporangium album TaxID=504805 RepID=A0A1G7XAM3_9ACTN|nr:chorismate mutase [Sinosporangium album]